MKSWFTLGLILFVQTCAFAQESEVIPLGSYRAEKIQMTLPDIDLKKELISSIRIKCTGSKFQVIDARVVFVNGVSENLTALKGWTKNSESKEAQLQEHAPAEKLILTVASDLFGGRGTFEVSAKRAPVWVEPRPLPRPPPPPEETRPTPPPPPPPPVDQPYFCSAACVGPDGRADLRYTEGATAIYQLEAKQGARSATQKKFSCNYGVEDIGCSNSPQSAYCVAACTDSYGEIDLRYSKGSPGRNAQEAKTRALQLTQEAFVCNYGVKISECN